MSSDGEVIEFWYENQLAQGVSGVGTAKVDLLKLATDVDGFIEVVESAEIDGTRNC